MAQAFDPPMLKSQTENLGVFPVWLLWTPDLHLSLSVEILVMEQRVPASVFLPGYLQRSRPCPSMWDGLSHQGTQGNYKQIITTFGTVIIVKGTGILLVSSQIWELYALVQTGQAKFVGSSVMA